MQTVHYVLFAHRYLKRKEDNVIAIEINNAYSGYGGNSTYATKKTDRSRQRRVLGQNGIKLSGGQKQKIALARALFRNSPVVIFDEAASSTDNYSEQQINALLDTKLKNKTVIIVTHRTDILKEVEQVVKLVDGKIQTGKFAQDS